MKLPLLVRRVHNWLALVVAVPALLWMAGGMYMVAVPLDVIHGDHLARAPRVPLEPATSRVTPAELARAYPGMTGFRLKHLLGREVYEIQRGKATSLADAATGMPIGPLDRETIRVLAARAYTGDAQVREIAWIDKAPREAGARRSRLWAVHYTGFSAATLYYSADTGELVARRHALWRWFDLAWMFHIFDFEAREDVNNPLLRTASALGLAASLSGVWLFLYSFKRRKRE